MDDDKETEENELEDTNEKDDSLFRKDAFQKIKLSDKLDQPFMPVSTHIGVVYTALAFLLSAAILWLIFGSIPIIVHGRGIVMSEAGLYSIQSKTSGIVKKILVKPGDFVHLGQLTAIIEDPEEQTRYQNAQEKLENLVEELNQLGLQIGIESRAEKEALQKMIQANEISIQELEQTIPKWEEELKNKEKLYEEKLMGLNDLQETRQMLSQNLIALETTKATLATLQANLAKMYRYQELKNKERLFLQAKQEKEILKRSLEYGNVYSQDRGVVLELLVMPGDRVTPGTPLMHVEYADAEGVKHVFYGYIPIKDGKIVRENMPVEIEPSTVNIDEYGAILGTVREVSLFAISKEKIANLIQNESLVEYLMQGLNTVTQIVIAPVLDPTTISGYKWTSTNGPPQKISTGTVCKITIIADRISPLFYFFSLWWAERIQNYFEEFRHSEK